MVDSNANDVFVSINRNMPTHVHERGAGRYSLLKGATVSTWRENCEPSGGIQLAVRDSSNCFR